MSEEKELENFSLTLDRDYFNIDGEEYYLEELSGYDRDAHLSDERNKADKNGVIIKYEDCQTSLIARSLHRKSTGDLVTKAEVRKFPSKLQMKLYDKCDKLNGFDELRDKKKAEDAAKND